MYMAYRWAVMCHKPYVFSCNAPEQSQGAAMFAVLLPDRCQMVLVLLERKQTSGESPYALVKQAGDSLIGIRTQCFAADKAGMGRNARPPKGRLQYCANIAMKVNTKMGGVNVKLVDNPQQVGPAGQQTAPDRHDTNVHACLHRLELLGWLAAGQDDNPLACMPA